MEVDIELKDPAILPLENSPLYSLYRKLGGPQTLCGREKCLVPARNRTTAVHFGKNLQ
jgi:hypothetical protein